MLTLFSISDCSNREFPTHIGLAGKTSLEQAKADQIAEYLICDLLNQYIQYLLEDDEFIKLHKRQECFEETIPFHLDKFETILIQNGGEYFTGNVSTIARVISTDFYTLACVVNNYKIPRL